MSYFLCFLAIAFFSTIEVTGKLFYHDVSPYAVTVDRFLIGAIFLLPFALKNLPKGLKGRDYLVMAGPGILNVAVSMLLLQLAIYTGKASIAALIISCNPLFVAAFAPLILKEKLDWPQIAGLLVSLAGLVVIVGQAGGFDPGAGSFLSLMFGLAAAVTFGLYTVISRPMVKRYGNFFFNFYTFLSGALVLLLVCLVAGLPVGLPQGGHDWLLVLYLGVLVTGLSYWFFFQGQKGIPTLAASLMFFLKPVLAVIWAGLLLDETITLWQGVGIAAVALGVNIKPFMSLRRR